MITTDNLEISLLHTPNLAKGIMILEIFIYDVPVRIRYKSINGSIAV